MIFVEGGTFMMGDGGGIYTDKNGKRRRKVSWTGYKDNKPPHKVTLDSYYLQKVEVTWADYDLYSKVVGKELRESSLIGKWGMRDPQQPVQIGTWQNSKDYCLWLGKLSNLTFDLPTEAQWEYAARSRGNPNVLYATDTGWIDEKNNIHKPNLRVKPGFPPIVGVHPPNPLGFHDMNGSVKEFVEDWFEYYTELPVTNPTGPATGKLKIQRGGVPARNYTATLYNRFETKFNSYSGYSGVRCALHLTSKKSANDLKALLNF